MPAEWGCKKIDTVTLLFSSNLTVSIMRAVHGVVFVVMAMSCCHSSLAEFDSIHDKLVPILKEISDFDASVSNDELPAPDSPIGKTSETLKDLESDTKLDSKYVTEVMSAAATVLAAAKQGLPERESAAESFRQKCAACFEPSAAVQTEDPGWQQHCALCYVQSEMTRLQQEMDAVKAKKDALQAQAAKESQQLQALAGQFSKVKKEYDAFRPPAKLSPQEKRVEDLQRDLVEAKRELELERARTANGDSAP